jgi:hypothetical protein
VEPEVEKVWARGRFKNVHRQTKKRIASVSKPMELVFVKLHRRRQMVAVSERTRDRPSGFHFERRFQYHAG